MRGRRESPRLSSGGRVASLLILTRWRHAVRVVAVALAVVGVSLIAQACGSSSSATTSKGGGSGTATSTGGSTLVSEPEVTQLDPAYTGIDKPYLNDALPAPTLKKGQSFKVGFLQNDESTRPLKDLQEAAQAEISRLGGSTVVLNADNSPSSQVSELNQLLTEKVNAIVAMPIVAQGLSTGFKRAAAEGIPVVTVFDNPTPQGGLAPGSVSDIESAQDYDAFNTMKALAARLPRGATFAIQGFAIPIQSLIYGAARQKYWGEKDGLKFVGQVNATAGTPQAYATALSTLFSKYPNVDAVVTMNDDAAAVATTVAHDHGKTHVAIATSNGGGPSSGPLLKSGAESVIVRQTWEEQGVQSAVAAYDALTKQHLPLPKTIELPGIVVTKANVAKITWVH